MIGAFLEHWPEYLIEAALLATFMLSACAAVIMVQHPSSWIRRRVRSPVVRRAIIGLAMGLTAVSLILSPWGKRSGAHVNPATTLTFAMLGKVQPWDAVFYIVAQFVGGIGGVALAAAIVPGFVRHRAVNCVATLPGRADRRGAFQAFAAEVVISFGLFITVLVTSNRAALAAYTPIIVGALVMLYITFEAPISGMSMNPARTFGSALAARDFRALWVYLIAPPAGMLLAAIVYTFALGPGHVYCCKLDHSGGERCIFNCRIDEMPGRARTLRP